MKIGFFGGSFNPPTNAHIKLAKSAVDTFNLDKVTFVPVGDYYNKANLAKAEDRYNMLSVACENEKNLEVSDLEIKIHQKLYAVDAFKLIEEQYRNSDLFFIMGADNFINITNWKDSNILLNKYNYIVLERQNIDIKSCIVDNEELKKAKDRIFVLNNEIYKNHSSTNFRNNSELRKNDVPKEVFNYIKKNGLYKEAR